MSLFGTDGIRDIAGRGNLEPAVVRRIGRAVAAILRGRPASSRRVLIGRDTRSSGPELESQLVDGLGGGAASLGVIPTPGVAWLVRATGAALGIVVSASHNPADYNGIKLVGPDGFKASDEVEAEVERLVREGSDPAPAAAARPEDLSSRAGEYIGFLRGALGSNRLRGRRLVVDCANGAASSIAPDLFRSAGADVVAVNAAPDGRNINVRAGVLEPDPLRERVLAERADLGIAYDGDADRCILVDETGAVRDGDFILGVAAESMAGAGTLKNRTVVSTVMANFGLEKFLVDRGITLRRSAVGDRWVADEMVRAGAVLGGEQSGHVIFLDALPTGDGMYTSIRILRIMAERQWPLSSLCRDLVKVPQTLVNVRVRARPDLEGLDGVQAAIRAAETGLAGRGRVLVRYSGTEPLCRVMVEGSDAEAVKRAVDSVSSAVREAIGE